MDKTVIVIIVIIIALAAGFFFWQRGFQNPPVPPTPLPEGIILFYSPDCPHCRDVEAFLAANNIDQKVKYTKLEVTFGFKTSPELVANSELAIQLAQKCKVDVSNGLSIPFLYDPPSGEAGGNGKCYVGEVDIPNFFKAQAGIK